MGQKHGVPGKLGGGASGTPKGDSEVEEVTGGSGGYRCHGACVTRRGRESDTKVNQDSCFAFDKYLTDEQSLFGAFDGHGPCGHLVSGFVKQQLPATIAPLSATIKDPAGLLVESFLQASAADPSPRPRSGPFRERPPPARAPEQLLFFPFLLFFLRHA